MPEEVQPPPTVVFNFSTPEAMIVWLEADTILNACLNSAKHVASAGQPEVARVFSLKALEWRKFMEEWMEKDKNQVVIASPADVPHLMVKP